VTVRLRDRVDVLWPATKVDTYTEEDRADWTKDPVRTDSGVRATVQPVSSTKEAVTAETIVSRWDCWLSGSSEVASSCRIRWDGDVYLIDGEVEAWKSGHRTRMLHCLLKRVR
jgi:hypothetical protein